MLYTAKCFWPGATEATVRAAAARLERGFRGAVYLLPDELVLCLLDAASPADAKASSERGGLPCERVVDSIWVAPKTNREE